MLPSLLFLLTHFGCADKAPNQSVQEFQSLRRQVLDGKYDETIPQLKNFLEKNPNSKHASRAGLFLFKCYFAQDDLENAKKWCDWTIEKHPRSLEAAKCKFKLVMIQMVAGDMDAAKKGFESLSQDAEIPQRPESKRLVQFLNEYSIKKND